MAQQRDSLNASLLYLRTVSWVFYIMDIALVAGGYLGIVSTGVRWIGWIVGRSDGARYDPCQKTTRSNR